MKNVENCGETAAEPSKSLSLADYNSLSFLGNLYNLKLFLFFWLIGNTTVWLQKIKYQLGGFRRFIGVIQVETKFSSVTIEPNLWVTSYKRRTPWKTFLKAAASTYKRPHPSLPYRKFDHNKCYPGVQTFSI